MTAFPPPHPALAKLRDLCLSLPGGEEVPQWDTYTYRVQGKIFAIYGRPDDRAHTGGRPSVSLKAAPGLQQLMVRDAPDRFYVPPYVGKAGWIGVRLDRRPPWAEIARLLRESWELVAPKRIKERRAGEASTARGTRPRRNQR